MANGSFGGGNGTRVSPYLVEDIKDLKAVRNNMEAHYKQTKNIECLGEIWDHGAIGFKGGYDGDNLTINNLSSNSSNSYSGSLFGSIQEDVELKNIIVVDCDINSNSYAGGIVGNVGWDNCKIINCHATGNVNGQYQAGGIAGYSSANNIILNCTANCYVTSQYSQAGGIIGVAESGTRIENSYSNGVIHGQYAGGLVGQVNEASIINCYAEGKALSTSYYVGGLVAYASSILVENCFAACDELGNDSYYAGNSQYTGGLLGYLSGSDININSSYYDSDLLVRTDSNKGTPKTTIQMKQKATFIDWDFDTIWKIDEGKSYPYFPTANVSTQCTAFILFRRLTRNFN